MANGKIVKYKRVYKITIEGKTDTVLPNEMPLSLKTAVGLLSDVVDVLDGEYKWRNVTIKEIKR